MRLMLGNLDRDIFTPSIRLRTREDLGYDDESLFAPEIVRVRSDDHRYRRVFSAMYEATRCKCSTWIR